MDALRVRRDAFAAERGSVPGTRKVRMRDGGWEPALGCLCGEDPETRVDRMARDAAR